eukprot:TRINITY_DN7631_c0_g1_i1.p1 TRINITY_DN7631_c0_g1~~TRINITY_DN7631_c0_g1_i1.p1  ORF type:complete len:535 (-),score=164.52 TRINITY_DN7631_c0_g1_i1:63-1517(-)
MKDKKMPKISKEPEVGEEEYEIMNSIELSQQNPQLNTKTFYENILKQSSFYIIKNKESGEIYSETESSIPIYPKKVINFFSKDFIPSGFKLEEIESNDLFQKLIEIKKHAYLNHDLDNIRIITLEELESMRKGELYSALENVFEKMPRRYENGWFNPLLLEEKIEKKLIMEDRNQDMENACKRLLYLDDSIDHKILYAKVLLSEDSNQVLKSGEMNGLLEEIKEEIEKLKEIRIEKNKNKDLIITEKDNVKENLFTTREQELENKQRSLKEVEGEEEVEDEEKIEREREALFYHLSSLYYQDLGKMEESRECSLKSVILDSSSLDYPSHYCSLFDDDWSSVEKSVGTYSFSPLLHLLTSQMETLIESNQFGEKIDFLTKQFPDSITDIVDHLILDLNEEGHHEEIYQYLLPFFNVEHQHPECSLIIIDILIKKKKLLKAKHNLKKLKVAQRYILPNDPIRFSPQYQEFHHQIEILSKKLRNISK